VQETLGLRDSDKGTAVRLITDLLIGWGAVIKKVGRKGKKYVGVKVRPNVFQPNTSPGVSAPPMPSVSPVKTRTPSAPTPQPNTSQPNTSPAVSSSPPGLNILQDSTCTFNEAFLEARHWTNKDIINNLKVQDLLATSNGSIKLNFQNFKEYLKCVLPDATPANYKEENLLTFSTHAFSLL
jgi:hypothetical protein